MGKYTKDGGVVASGIPVVEKKSFGDTKLFGIYRGKVIRPVYPEEPENTSGEKVEYIVKVRGQEYPGAINMIRGGGQFNFDERIRKPTEKSKKGKLDAHTYDEDTDGESVFVMFLEGRDINPIIIGADQHPARSKYKKTKKSDKERVIEEFNGVEVSIDKDANYLIKQVGKKDPTAKILNEDAVGAKIMIGGLKGEITLKSSKEAVVFMDDKGSIFATDKKGSKLSMDVDGELVKLELFKGQSITMKDDKITSLTTGGAKTEIDGDADKITAITTGGAKAEIDGNADKIAAVTAGGAKTEIDGNADKITSLTAGGAKTEIDGNADKLTSLTTGGAKAEIDGTADSIKLKTTGTGELHLSAGKVALGTSVAELLMQISQQLQELITWTTSVGATHTHQVSNATPAAPGPVVTLVPDQAAGYVTLGTNLTAIKVLIDTIKGTL